MSVLPTTNGTNGTPLPKKTNPSIYGPFHNFLRYTAVDLSRCSKIRRDTKKIESYFRTAIAIIVFVLCALYIFKFFSVKAKITTIQWAESNFDVCFCAFSILSVGCLIYWSYSDAFSLFEEQLQILKNKRIRSLEYLDDYRKFYYKTVVFTGIFLIFSIVYSFKNMLYSVGVEKNDEETSLSTSKWTILDPFVFAHMAILSVYATYYYNISNCALVREAEYFNKELKEALESKQFYTSNGIRSFNLRHLQLLKVLQLLNRYFGKLAAGGAFITGFVMFNTTLMNTGFSDQLALFYKIVLNIGSIVFTGLLASILFPPSKIQNQLEETKNILMNDEILTTETQPAEIQNAVKMIIDRVKYSHTKLFVIECIPIGSRTPHLALFLLPMLGSAFGVWINVLQK